MGAAHDQMRPLALGTKRIRQIANLRGFELVNVGFRPPADDDTPPRVALVLRVRSRPERDELAAQVDASMKEEMERSWREELDRRAEEARKKIKGELTDEDVRRRGKGFL